MEGQTKTLSSGYCQTSIQKSFFALKVRVVMVHVREESATCVINTGIFLLFCWPYIPFYSFSVVQWPYSPSGWICCGKTWLFRLGFLVGEYSFNAWGIIILDYWLQSDSTGSPLHLCLLRWTHLSYRLCHLDRSTKYKSHSHCSSLGKSFLPLVVLQMVQACYCCLSIKLGGPGLLMTKFEVWGKGRKFVVTWAPTLL